MPSEYPGALDALPTDKTNKTTAKDDHADSHNEANSAINALQETLGVNPQGGASDVAERLDLLGEGAVTAPLDLEAANATDPVIRIQVAGDENKRLVICADGRLTWDDDSEDETPADLYLTAEHDLEISDDLWIKDDSLYIVNGLETDGPEYQMFVLTRSDETSQILAIDKSGRIRWYDAEAKELVRLEPVAGGLKITKDLEVAEDAYVAGKVEAGDETNGETGIGPLGPNVEDPEPAVVLGKNDQAILYLDESGEDRKLVCRFLEGGEQDVAVEGAPTDHGLVTSLPESPAEGDVCHLKVTKAATGADMTVVWDLIYDGEDWVYQGGPPLHASSTTERSLTNQTSYASLPTDPLAITLPAIAGTWDIRCEARIDSDAGVDGMYSYSVGATAANDNWAGWSEGDTAGIKSEAIKRYRHTGVASGAKVEEKGKTDSGATIDFANRHLWIWPARLG